MRVHVVSDVHGNAEALRRAGDGADALFVLGDLVDFVDYQDPHAGILGRVLGPEVSAQFGRLRAAGAPGELGAYATARWADLPDARAVVEEAVREQYADLFAAMTAPTWAIPGNVDVATLWPEFARPGLFMPDGQVVDVGGLRVGFVGGAPLPAGRAPRRGGPWHPYVLRAEEYTARVAALGTVDLLCSHVPPAVPELAYDVVARRPEVASPALLDLVRRDRPRAALFGHVPSRWRPARGSDAPRPSTSDTSGAPAAPTSCAGSGVHR